MINPAPPTPMTSVKKMRQGGGVHRVMGEGNRELVLANVAGEGASLNSQGEEKDPGMGTHRESVFQA